MPGLLQEKAPCRHSLQWEQFCCFRCLFAVFGCCSRSTEPAEVQDLQQRLEPWPNSGRLELYPARRLDKHFLLKPATWIAAGGLRNFTEVNLVSLRRLSNQIAQPQIWHHRTSQEGCEKLLAELASRLILLAVAWGGLSLPAFSFHVLPWNVVGLG